MRKINNYIKILDSAFNNPPKNVPEIAETVLDKYPCKFYIEKDCGAMLLKINDGVFYISNVAVRINKQRQGLGKKLMEKIHKENKGIFIIKSRNAQVFYRNIGYINIYKNVMVFCNDDKKVC